jgi:chromosomal replication initiator protein
MFLKVLKKANKDHDGYLLSVDEISKLKKLQVNSFRDINGIINKILLNKQTGKNNSEYINELISDKSVDYLEAIKPEHLLNYVSKVFQVDKALIVSKNRSTSVNESRKLFANLARNHTDLSLNQIGLYLGGRSHSTVLSYIERSKISPMVVNEVNKFNNSLALKDVG